MTPGAGGVHEPAARGPGGAEGAGEGDVDDAAPLLVAHLEEVGGAAEAGVVDHHVDAAEGLGGIEERRDVGLLRDVADHLRDPIGTELGGQLLLGLASRRAWVSLKTTALAPSSKALRTTAAPMPATGGGGDHDRAVGEQAVARHVGRQRLLGAVDAHRVPSGEGSRGRPSTRSARMFLCTSSLPP